LDAAGNVWLTGETASTDFPTTAYALNTTHNGALDVFVVCLASNGQNLLYSTFLGGSSVESGRALALDAAGNVWLTGETASTDFPTTADALNTTYNGVYDVFVACLASNGHTLLYSTFLGGSSYDYGWALAVDATGNAWLTGWTEDATTDFPTTPDALNTTHNGDRDVFVACLASNGQTLLYSTFLGGSEWETGRALAFNAAGNVWVAGNTQDATTDFPTTPDAFDSTHNGNLDVFLSLLAYPPSAPQTLAVVASSTNFVYLVWDPPLLQGGTTITAYRVYRSTTSGTYGTFLAETSLPLFLDSLVVSGETYYYVVTAVNGVDESPSSNEVTITLPAEITPPDAPESLSTTPGDHFVELTWSAPSHDGGSPITNYRVYRGTTSGSYAPLRVVTSTAYNDTTALRGATYYYVVTAVNARGESVFSAEVSATLSPPTESSESQDSVAPSFVIILGFLGILGLIVRKNRVR
jgi:hypothetical protein